MVAVLTGSVKPVFRPDQVGRLRAVLAREIAIRLPRIPLTLAIARLLPAADPSRLDDPDTRDGTLSRCRPQ